MAAANGNLDTIETLLEAEARLNCGKSCLLEPARNGRDDILKILLRAGEDPNVPGANWETPLFLAQKNGHTSTAALLKSHAAMVRTSKQKDSNKD